MKSLSSMITRRASGPLIALALAASGNVHAAAIDFQFDNQGFGIAVPCATPNCVEGSAIGQADDVGDSIPGSWSSSLDFSAMLDTGTASGTWQFFDIDASANDLFGTFAATFDSSLSAPYGALISYVVTGGNGSFLGATGIGSSMISVDSDLNFTESGRFSVTPAVPEPTTTALVLAGLAALGYRPRCRGD